MNLIDVNMNKTHKQSLSRQARAPHAYIAQDIKTNIYAWNVGT